MPRFPHIAIHVSMADCVMYENSVGPDDDDGDKDDKKGDDSDVAFHAAQEES